MNNDWMRRFIYNQMLERAEKLAFARADFYAVDEYRWKCFKFGRPHDGYTAFDDLRDKRLKYRGARDAFNSYIDGLYDMADLLGDPDEVQGLIHSLAVSAVEETYSNKRVKINVQYKREWYLGKHNRKGVAK